MSHWSGKEAGTGRRNQYAVLQQRPVKAIGRRGFFGALEVSAVVMNVAVMEVDTADRAGCSHRYARFLHGVIPCTALQ